MKGMGAIRLNLATILPGDVLFKVIGTIWQVIGMVFRKLNLLTKRVTYFGGCVGMSPDTVLTGTTLC
jgi:hypothetical protein